MSEFEREAIKLLKKMSQQLASIEILLRPKAMVIYDRPPRDAVEAEVQGRTGEYRETPR